MNFEEACQVLEVPESVTPEDAKKKYKQLSKKYHPDVNKEVDANDKFKKINQAYQVVSQGKQAPTPGFAGNPWADLFNNDFFNRGGSKPMQQMPPITLYTNLSFKDSIFGTKIDLNFHRKIKCDSCQGQGEILKNNGCKTCGGRGQTTQQQGNMMFVVACPTCRGKKESDPCLPCQSKGFVDSETSINVTIPGGVQNQNILRLQGMGHFQGSFGPMDQYTDAHLHIHVNEDSELKLEGADVVLQKQISLREALQGTAVSVRTLKGDQEINIPALTKNKDEIILPNLGVNQTGNQRVILDVIYPANIAKVLDALQE